MKGTTREELADRPKRLAEMALEAIFSQNEEGVKSNPTVKERVEAQRKEREGNFGKLRAMRLCQAQLAKELGVDIDEVLHAPRPFFEMDEAVSGREIHSMQDFFAYALTMTANLSRKAATKALQIPRSTVEAIAEYPERAEKAKRRVGNCLDGIVGNVELTPEGDLTKPWKALIKEMLSKPDQMVFKAPGGKAVLVRGGDIELIPGLTHTQILTADEAAEIPFARMGAELERALLFFRAIRLNFPNLDPISFDEIIEHYFSKPTFLSLRGHLEAQKDFTLSSPKRLHALAKGTSTEDKWGLSYLLSNVTSLPKAAAAVGLFYIAPYGVIHSVQELHSIASHHQEEVQTGWCHSHANFPYTPLRVYVEEAEICKEFLEHEGEAPQHH